MDDPIQILKTRIEDDERFALAASVSPWRPFVRAGLDVVEGDGWTVASAVADVDAVHIARHDPSRVLGDVEALRKVIDCWPDPFGNWSAEQAEAARAMKAEILRLLARPTARP